MFRVIFLLVLSANVFAWGTCDKKTPDGVTYVPTLTQCEGKAAIILYGKFLTSFSAVVRDCNNDDRDPCHKTVNTCAANSASPYKAQTILKALIYNPRKDLNGQAQIFCLKERGDSKVYKLVRRITIKLRNPVRKPGDFFKFCLPSRVKTVNPVKILDVISSKSRKDVGYSSICKTQGYLDCNISYEARCPKY